MPCSGPRLTPAAHERVGGVRFRQGAIGGHGGEAFELRAERLDPGEVDLRQPPAGQRAARRARRKAARPARRRCPRRPGNRPRHRRPTAQRPLRRRHAERSAGADRSASPSAGRWRGERAAGPRRVDLALEIVDHQPALGERVGDAHELLGRLDGPDRDVALAHGSPLSGRSPLPQPKTGSEGVEASPQSADRCPPPPHARSRRGDCLVPEAWYSRRLVNTQDRRPGCRS